MARCGQHAALKPMLAVDFFPDTMRVATAFAMAGETIGLHPIAILREIAFEAAYASVSWVRGSAYKLLNDQSPACVAQNFAGVTIG